MKKYRVLMLVVSVIGSGTIQCAEKDKPVGERKRKEEMQEQASRGVLEVFLPKDIASLVENYAEVGVFKKASHLEHNVTNAMFSDNDSVIGSTGSGEIFWWNVETNVISTMEADNQLIQARFLYDSYCTSAGAKIILADQYRKRLFIVNSATKTLLQEVQFQRLVRSAVLNNTGRWLIVLTIDTSLRKNVVSLYDTQLNLLLVDDLFPEKSITSACFSPDDTSLIIADKDGDVGIIDISTRKNLNEIRIPNASRAILSPNSKNILITSSLGVSIVDAHSGKQKLDLSEYESARYNHDGTLLIAISRDQRVCILRAADGTLLQQLMQKAAPATVLKASFSPDGSKIVIVDSEFVASIWEMTPQLTSGEIKIATQEAYQGIVQQLKKLRSRDNIDVLLPQGELAALDEHRKYLEENPTISLTTLKYYQEEFNRLNALVETIDGMLGQVMDQVKNPAEKENIIKYIHHLFKQGKSEEVIINIVINKFKTKKGDQVGGLG